MSSVEHARWRNGEWHLYQVMVDGEACRSVARGYAKLAIDRRQMALDGTWADDQRLRNFFVAQPPRDEAKHVELALGQAILGTRCNRVARCRGRLPVHRSERRDNLGRHRGVKLVDAVMRGVDRLGQVGRWNVFE